jgi:hypothetical protein
MKRLRHVLQNVITIDDDSGDKTVGEETAALEQIWSQASKLDRHVRTLLMGRLEKQCQQEVALILVQLPSDVWVLIFHALVQSTVVDEEEDDPEFEHLFSFACTCWRYELLVSDYVRQHHEQYVTSEPSIFCKFAPSLKTLAPHPRLCWSIMDRMLPRLTQLTSLTLPPEMYQLKNEHLAPLHALEHLVLNDSNNLTGDAIKNKLHLKTLGLNRTYGIRDGAFKKLRNLTSLSLCQNNLITDKPLKSMWLLQSLDLSRNDKITDNGIAHMRQMRSLCLKKNRNITGAALVNMTNLTALNLYDTSRIQDADITHLTLLQHLDLRLNSKITGQAVSCLTALTSLNLCDNRRVTEGYITGLRRLSYLWLDHTNAVDAGLVPITSNAIYALGTQLRGLFIGYSTWLDGWALRACTNLKTLALDETPQFKPSDINALVSLTCLELGSSHDAVDEQSLVALTALQVLTYSTLNEEPPLKNKDQWKARGVRVSERCHEYGDYVFSTALQ